ncbi:MAG: GNAT family N-acetyltransferase [Clostridia bacterium]
MLVRSIETTDKEVFFRLCESFYNSGATAREYSAEITEKTFSYLVSHHENLWGYLLIDKDTNEAVGYTLITSYWCNEDGGNVIVLDELFVDPAVRHKGYGQKLLEWIETEFKNKAVSITLEVVTTNTIAKQLYKKLGFDDDGFEVMSKSFKKQQA